MLTIAFSPAVFHGPVVTSECSQASWHAPFFKSQFVRGNFTRQPVFTSPFSRTRFHKSLALRASFNCERFTSQFSRTRFYQSVFTIRSRFHDPVFTSDVSRACFHVPVFACQFPRVSFQEPGFTGQFLRARFVMSQCVRASVH